MSPSTMTLYHGWMSSASRRVRLCLAEKGIAYESVPLDMGKQEHHSPEYLALNPNGVVPTLEEPDGFVLWTRLAPRPLEGDGGMPAQAVEEVEHLARDAQVVFHQQDAQGKLAHGTPAMRAYSQKLPDFPRICR